jgi:hypothetical protein
MTKIITPETFIDRLIKKNEPGQPFALTNNQREILRLAFAFDEDGRLAFDTVLYSCPKKSGKSAIMSVERPIRIQGIVVPSVNQNHVFIVFLIYFTGTWIRFEASDSSMPVPENHETSGND